MPVVKRHRIGEDMPAVIHPDPDPAALALCRGLALDSLKERHYPGYTDYQSPDLEVRDGQMVVSLDHYLAHRRALNHVMARAARDGLIFTGKAGTERRFTHDGNTSNEWKLVTLERLKRAAEENFALSDALRLGRCISPGPLNVNLVWANGPRAAVVLQSGAAVHPGRDIASGISTGNSPGNCGERP